MRGIVKKRKRCESGRGGEREKRGTKRGGRGFFAVDVDDGTIESLSLSRLCERFRCCSLLSGARARRRASEYTGSKETEREKRERRCLSLKERSCLSRSWERENEIKHKSKRKGEKKLQQPCASLSSWPRASSSQRQQVGSAAEREREPPLEETLSNSPR